MTDKTRMAVPPRHDDTGSDRGARGATAAEYALLVGLIAVVVLGSVTFLGGGSKGSLDKAAKPLAGTTAPATTGGGGGGGTGGGTGGGVGSTTTTSSPTTTASTTAVPTTQATTTTTTTTTTTAPPQPTSSSPTFTSPRSTTSGSKWSATTEISLTDDLGQPVAGAQVTVRITTSGRSGSSTTQVFTTGPDGSIELTAGPYNRNGSSKVNTVSFEVIAVGGAPPWNGSGASVTASRP